MALTIGTVSYPTANTWSVTISGIAGLVYVTVSDGTESVELLLEGTAAHVLRAVAGASEASVTVVPGAPGVAAQALAQAGGVLVRTIVPMGAAQAAAAAGGVGPRAALAAPAANLFSAAAGVTLLGTGHRLRASAGGFTAIISIVPGAPGAGAQAVAQAGGIAARAALSAAAALASSGAGAVAVSGVLQAPAASAAFEAGDAGMAEPASLRVPAALAVFDAGGIGSTTILGVEGADALTEAGEAGILAVVRGAAGAMAILRAGGITFPGATEPTEPPTLVAKSIRVGLLMDPVGVGIIATDGRIGLAVTRREMGMAGYAFQGCDFRVFFPRVLDAVGRAVPLDGATLACSALVDGDRVDAPATSVDAEAGTAEASFSAAQTAEWSTGARGKVDGVLHLPGGLVYFIGRADFVVADPVTPTP